MYKIKILFYAIMLLASLQGSAQGFFRRTTDWIGDGFPKTHHIIFNEGGEMIAFPGAVIRRHDKLVFSVRVNKNSFTGNVKKLFDKLTETYDFYKNDHTHQAILWTLFRNQDSIDEWLNELDNYHTFQQLKTSDKSSLFMVLMDDSSEAFKELNAMHMFPVTAFLHYLKSMYTIKVTYGCDSVSEDLVLRPLLSREAAKDSCYWWCSDTLRGDEFFKPGCGKLPNTMSFNLLINDPFRNTLVDWYNQHIPSTTDSLEKLEDLQQKTIAIAKILQQQKLLDSAWDSGYWLQSFSLNFSKRGLDSTYRRLFGILPDRNLTDSTLIGLIDAQLSKNIQQVPALVKGKLGDQASDLNTYLDEIRQLERWLMAWLWYNKGYLIVNPLLVHPRSWTDSINKRVADIDGLLKEEKDRKKFLDSVQRQMPALFRNYDTLLRTQDSLKRVSKNIDRYDSTIKALKKLLAADDAIKSDTTTGQRAYAGVLPFSLKKRYTTRKGLVVSKQFAYSSNEKAISEVYRNARDRERTQEVPDNEHVVTLLHNVPQGAEVKVTKAQSAFDDTEEFTLLVQKALKSIDSSGLLQAALAPGLGKVVSSLAKAFFGAQVDDEAKIKARSLILQNYPGVPPFVADYLKTSAQKSASRLDSSMEVKSSFEKGTDLSHGYLTSYDKIDDSRGAHQVDLTLSVDTIKGKGSLKVGGLHFAKLLAGVFFTHDPVTQTSIDTSGNGFKTSSHSNNVQTVIGVKLYPVRTYLRDKSILPRYPLRRLSIDLSMSIPKILDNFYVGLGYDVVPGLTFTIGGNYARFNYYQVQNAQIVNSAVRYKYSGTYYGVSINPVIFVQFIKLFFN